MLKGDVALDEVSERRRLFVSASGRILISLTKLPMRAALELRFYEADVTVDEGFDLNLSDFHCENRITKSWLKIKLYFNNP